MARESTYHTEYLLQKKVKYWVYKGEFLGLKQPCLQDADCQQWTEGGLWGGSRREYRPEKLAGDLLSVTLSYGV